jgi:hypothetical protein
VTTKLDTCAFCGCTGHDFPREHWVPDWLSKRLVPTHATGVSHQLPGIPEFASRYFQLTVDHVCGNCNGGWMSDMETRTADDVFPMIVADYRTALTVQSLERVTDWVYLKLISLELGRPSEQPATHPAATYRTFKQTQKPPFPNCSLALGARTISDPNPNFITWSSHSGEGFRATIPELPSVQGYHTTLVLGHLVIDAYGTSAEIEINGSEHPINLTAVEHAAGLQPIWPPRGEFTWPPPQRYRNVIESDALIQFDRR